MLNFSPEKLFLVGLIALIVLGPGRLPQAARTLGRVAAELRRMSSSFQQEVKDAMGDSLEPLQQTADSMKRLQRTNVRQMVQETLAPPAVGEASSPSNGATSSPAVPSSAPPDDPSLN